MSDPIQFPNAMDNDLSIPIVNDNITEIGADAINALRDAVFSIEQYIGPKTDGYGASGSLPSIAAFLGVSFEPNGYLKPGIISSAITSMGLIPISALPNSIPESKLSLDVPTIDLNNSVNNLSAEVNEALGWIATTGIQLEPHLLGVPDYRHSLNQIDISHDLVNFPYLLNKFRGYRTSYPNNDAYHLINDINNEFLAHEWADGSISGTVQTVTTNNGSSYPSNFAHTASGIFIDSARFESIPQTNDNLQLFADYMDQSSLLSLGTRTQNLYANGISVNSRSSSLTADGYGQSIVPSTPVTAYLKGSGNLGNPLDKINIGDDIIQFNPPQDGYLFDEQFSLVKVGDIVDINYGLDGYGVQVQFVISEKKYEPGHTYIVRIAGKNVAYSNNGVASITKPLFNNNKYGVLAIASGVTSDLSGNSFTGVSPSLIVGSPRGAQCLGLGFTPDEFNETHYLLYLVLYPSGNPLDGYTVLSAIDVTGNAGITPGAYTLESIVAATNIAFRRPGFNYRFIAFSYQGEFGIMLADSYNNAAFSIANGVVNSSGSYDQTATQNLFPSNVIDVFPSTASAAPDPLGFGPFNANVSSPLFQMTYGSAVAAEVSTRVFVPLNRNSYYVNGAEQDILALDIGQAQDQYGDGYWSATISNVALPVYGYPGYQSVKYLITQDLSTSGLKVGKTLVVQPSDGYLGAEGANGVNYGRFVITSIDFTCNPVQTMTIITVYDAVHGIGGSPVPVAAIGTPVDIYFGSDSVSFNAESANDFGVVGVPFKRYFEVYVDQNTRTFTHERGRFNPSGPTIVNGITLNNTLSIAGAMDVMEISPKLRGYLFSSVSKITLSITSFNVLTGIFTGYLSSYDGTSFTRLGPTITGKLGEVARFYDETNTDYIDILFSWSNTLSSFSTHQYIDIQLFPSLSLDEEIMLIGSCQVNNATNSVSHIRDQRQFGNTSEEQFTTSALNYISAPERLLHFNGVLRGFDISGIANEYISVSGGFALVDGNLLHINDQVITIPKIQEVISNVSYTINFALCVNSVGELITQPITDYDSSVGTPSSGDRVMTVINAVTGNSYVVDSNLFSYILNNRKDLTPLYIVSSTVSGTRTSAVVSLTSRDVRRFVNDSDSNVPAVLTSDNSQGNFKTLYSALNWLKFNSAYQDVLQVKGSFSISDDPGLNFPLNIEGIGSTSSLSFNEPISISNINFSNIEVTFSLPTSSTNTFTLQNVNFDNCLVNICASNIDGITFTNCVVNVTGLIYNGFAGAEVSFVGSTINVGIAQAFAVGSGLSFDNCTFNYTYNPVGGTPTYSASDLVNAGSGLMYANIIVTAVNGGALDGFSVTGCTFNNTNADHFPFISLQLGGTSTGFVYGALAQNITIANNTFNCVPVTEDRRAVIAITSTITSPSSSNTNYPPFPKLVNANISGNICNYDQMILISTVRVSGHPITGAMITCVNCNVSNNTCGVIAHITSSDIPSSDNNSITSNGLAIRDKSDTLVISENSCKLITNLDSTGQYIAFHAFEGGNNTSDGDNNWVKVGTGSVSIVKNTCNWILDGMSSWANGSSSGNINDDGVLISGNRLSPANPSFLSGYTDTNSGITPPAIGILLRASILAQPDYAISQSIITGNFLNRKNLISQSSGLVQYYYTFGISCYASAMINSNTISSVCGGSSSSMIYLDGSSAGGPTIMCDNNTLSRGTYSIAAYIQGPTAAASNTVSITDNIFDSNTVDGTNTATGFHLGTGWAFFDNYNQALEDISAGGLNFTEARSIEFVSQSGQLTLPNDVNCLYVLNGVLGFNNSGGIFYPISLGGAASTSALNFDNVAITSSQAISSYATYNWMDVDTTSGAITITLPTISAINPLSAGRFFYFNDASGNFGTNNLTISVASGSGNTLHLAGQNEPNPVVINWPGATGLIYTDGNNSWYVVPLNQPPSAQSSVFPSGITVNGDQAIFTHGALVTSGGLQVTYGGVSVGGLIQTTKLTTSDITIGDIATIGNQLIVDGVATFDQTIAVSGGSTFGGDINAAGGLTVADNLVAGDISTAGLLSTTGGLSVSGQSTFVGPSTFSGVINTGCTVLFTPSSNTIGNAAPYSATYTDNTNAAIFQIVGGADITTTLTVLIQPRVGTVIFDFSALNGWTNAHNINVACTANPSMFLAVSNGGVSSPTGRVVGSTSYPRSLKDWSAAGSGGTSRILTVYCDGTNLFAVST